jgi:hypothetical protein
MKDGQKLKLGDAHVTVTSQVFISNFGIKKNCFVCVD